ncbi:MAG: DUF2961 domain-containing protein [Bacteroidales bacterium]|nr:DUF2961 domain-containing protein [Bacteroidales bacterium]
MKRFDYFLIFLIFLMVISCNTHAQTITTGSLFEEMVDLERLSTYPSPNYKMVQFSSYDHRSTVPGGPEWWANSDGFGGEPEPNFEEVITYDQETGMGEFVIADVEGPGAIVRLWTAAMEGEITMYIGDMNNPYYEGPARNFFQQPYNYYFEGDYIDEELFEKAFCQRDACYAPIPFAERLRVTWKGNLNEIHFYQMQVRLYEKYTMLMSFSQLDIREYSEVINRVAGILADPDKNFPYSKGNSKIKFDITLKPGESLEALQLEGSAAIEKLVLKVDSDDPDLALRQTIMHISFDEYPWAQVQSPVGDFFGAAPGINPYQSLPFTVDPDGTMTCRYVMPFENSCKILFQNLGDQDVIVTGSVSSKDYNWDGSSMHFRARWRADHNLYPSVYHTYDVPFLIAAGKGTYVGTTSILMNPADVPTPWGNWWGEGDEKVFVDFGEVPSLFGTGSEDYYNYSWSSPDIFFFPFCGQPRNDGPGNRGFVTNYRWHISDPIPFEREIRFYMELYTHRPTPGLSYARIGYHYARPGLTDDHFPIMPEDVRPLELPENWQPVASHGSRNSVFYQAEEIIASDIDTEFREDNLYAGGKLMVWKPRLTKESLDFLVPVAEDGKYRIYFTAALNLNSGIFSASLNGNAFNFSDGTSVKDLCVPYRTLLRNFSLEPVELKKDTNLKITIHYTGSQSGSSEPEIGIDFIWIQKLE